MKRPSKWTNHDWAPTDIDKAAALRFAKAQVKPGLWARARRAWANRHARRADKRRALARAAGIVLPDRKSVV